MFMKKNDNTDLTQKLCILLLIVALLSVVFMCFSEGISGNDFWWHVKTGKWIVENKAVPTTDIFSWIGTKRGISWTAHEWLSDVIFYYLHSTFGDIAVFILSIVAALSMIFLLFFQCRKYIEKNFLVGGLFLGLFSVLTSLFFYGRPHIFSYFLFFWELRILYEFVENQKSKKIFFIPFIAMLWSNLHGGSSNLSYILCLIVLFSGLFNIDYERVFSERFDRKSLEKLLIVTFGSVIGIMVNPIGFDVLTYPYVNLNDNLSMSFISEWQSPDAKIIGNLILYFLPMLLMTIGILCREKKIRVVDLLIMFSFMFLFFRSVRFIILWYIAAAFYAFRYIPELKVKKIEKKAEKITVILMVFLLMLPFCIGVSEMIQTYKNGTIITKTVSDKAIEIVKEDAPVRIFNDYNLGEALIYHDIQVFFDSRADLYAQENIMADGISLITLEPVSKSQQKSHIDVEAMIEKYRFDAILILKGRALYSYIVNNSERFALVYEDNELGYFRVLEK